MIDQILANPGISQNDLAKMFGYTPSWISTVMASDAFQMQLEARRQELVDPIVRDQVRMRMESLVNRSLEVLTEKLARPVEEISDQMALRSYEVATRAAGYGVKQQDSPVQVNMNLHLETLSSNLVGLLRRKRTEVLEHDNGTKATDSDALESDSAA